MREGLCIGVRHTRLRIGHRTEMENRLGIRHFKNEERGMIRMLGNDGRPVPRRAGLEQVLVMVRAMGMRKGRDQRAPARITVETRILDEQREDQKYYDRDELMLHGPILCPPAGDVKAAV